MWIGFLISTTLLASCGGGGSGDNNGPSVAAYSCNVPCLASAPTLSSSTISSGTSSNVSLTFALQGDVTNISDISVIMANSRITATSLPVGNGVLIGPITKNQVTVNIKINASSTPGTYYPNISITAKTPANTGGLNYIDPTKSESAYTYTEGLGGKIAGPYLTPFAVPLFTVK
jgi:hypothetical protein